MSTPGISRRRALAGLTTAGLSLPLLSACGDDSSSTVSDPAAGAAPGDTSAGGGDAGPATGGSLTSTSDVPVGGGVVITAERVVVTQPQAGDFKCFTAVCTHTGCLVNSVTATINCPCHGSVFDISTGEVLGGPAPAPLAEMTISVEGDRIVLA